MSSCKKDKIVQRGYKKCYNTFCVGAYVYFLSLCMGVVIKTPRVERKKSFFKNTNMKTLMNRRIENMSTDYTYIFFTLSKRMCALSFVSEAHTQTTKTKKR